MAVCDYGLTVGSSNLLNYPSTLRVSGFRDLLEIMRNPSKFQPLPAPSKTWKSWPEPSLGHLSLKLFPNCKSDKNFCIYYVLSTSRWCILVPCLVPNHEETNSGMETVLEFDGPDHEYIVIKMTPKLVPREPESHQKSNKIQVWSPRCLVGCPCDVRIAKIVSQASTITPPNVKMDVLKPTKIKFVWCFMMSVIPVTRCMLTGGW